MSNNTNDNEVAEIIKKNYAKMNQMMVEEMLIASKHNGLTGNYREEMWMKFFRSIIPQKFSMAQGVILIDSEGNASNEVDIAVFDEQYTPYVFQFNTLKFIPIEAVAVVIECKSTSLNKNKLREWSKKIDNLKPSPTGIARMATGYSIGLTNSIQKRTRPIKILATMKQYTKDASSNNHEVIEKIKVYFDFIIYEEKKSNERMFTVVVPNEGKSLNWWGKTLNEGIKIEENDDGLELQHKEKIPENVNTYYKFLDIKQNRLTNTLEDLRIEGNDLLSLNLQLNQLLMLSLLQNDIFTAR
jgi:hypothetical protein